MPGAVSKIVGIVVALAVLLIIVPFLGGVAGWLFALVFNDSFDALCRLLRIEATGFQLGAALGFIGAFMRTTVSKG